MADALRTAGFDSTVPAVFSWLGVSEYLTLDAIEAVLTLVSGSAASTEICLTYAPPEQLLDDTGREFRSIVTSIAAASGEPFLTLLDPDAAAGLLERCGLRVVDHPSQDDLVERYFAARPDRLRPYTAERLITGVVP